MSAPRFYLPTLGNRTEIEAVLAGLRPELYRRMLGEISAQLRLATISVRTRFRAAAGLMRTIERLWNEVMRRLRDSASRRFAGQPDAPNAPGLHCVSG
jgi:hypothetical protein